MIVPLLPPARGFQVLILGRLGHKTRQKPEATCSHQFRRVALPDRLAASPGTGFVNPPRLFDGLGRHLGE